MTDPAEIRSLIGKGALDEAKNLLRIRLERRPEDVDALKLAAEVDFRGGNREDGFAKAMRAARLAPGDVNYALDCAFNLVRAGRRYDAVMLADLAAAQRPVDPSQRDALGAIYTHCEAPESAIVHFREACRLEPGSARFRYNLASVQRMLGDTAGAEHSLDLAIQLDGGDGQAHLARSQLRRQTAGNNHVDGLRTMLRKTGNAADQIPIGYALAKELEDLGQFEESFRFLSAASERQRASLNYDAEREFSLIRTLRDFDYARCPTPPDEAAQGPAPIFVIGLPRSGTTLVERIIASSGDVKSAGEPQMLAAELWRALSREQRPETLDSAITRTMAAHGGAIAQSYRELLGARFPSGRVIDKTPGNYLFAGLIAACMPAARIVCLRRSPMDSCYAMYKTLFSGAYPYTYRLDELADYFIEWDRLIGRWEDSLGNSWLTVRYEELIATPEPVMRRIVGHCGLVWNDKSLEFHRLETPVTSASAGQVSQPLHNRSVGLWKRYAAQLAPLAERFRAAGLPSE